MENKRKIATRGINKWKRYEPDWSYWLKRDLWSLDEGAYLLMRINPKEPRRYQRETLEELQSLARDAIATGALRHHPIPWDASLAALPETYEPVFKPAVFVKWAASKGIEIPPELEPLLRVEELEPQPNKPRSAVRADERDNMLMVIGMLAQMLIAQGRRDFGDMTKPNAKAIITALHRHAEDHGINVSGLSHSTLSPKLTEAFKLILQSSFIKPD